MLLCPLEECNQVCSLFLKCKKHLQHFPLKGFWEAIIIKPFFWRQREKMKQKNTEKDRNQGWLYETAFHFGACLPGRVHTCKFISYFNSSFHNYILSIYLHARNCTASSCWTMIAYWNILWFLKLSVSFPPENFQIFHIKKNKINNWTSLAKMQHSRWYLTLKFYQIYCNIAIITFQKTLQVRILGSHNAD